MALMGAEVLLYPTAIGSEPPDPAHDSRRHWQNAMRGHAAANLTPVAASNRIGAERAGDGTEVTFYGSSFIADWQGEMLAEADRVSEGITLATLDLARTAGAPPELGCLPGPPPRSLPAAHASRRPSCTRRLTLALRRTACGGVLLSPSDAAGLFWINHCAWIGYRNPS